LQQNDFVVIYRCCRTSQIFIYTWYNYIYIYVYIFLNILQLFHWIGLRKIYRKPRYLMVKPIVSS
jgi:hypothetical protein